MPFLSLGDYQETKDCNRWVVGCPQGHADHRPGCRHRQLLRWWYWQYFRHFLPFCVCGRERELPAYLLFILCYAFTHTYWYLQKCVSLPFVLVCILDKNGSFPGSCDMSWSLPRPHLYRAMAFFQEGARGEGEWTKPAPRCRQPGCSWPHKKTPVSFSCAQVPAGQVWKGDMSWSGTLGSRSACEAGCRPKMPCPHTLPPLQSSTLLIQMVDRFKLDKKLVSLLFSSAFPLSPLYRLLSILLSGSFFPYYIYFKSPLFLPVTHLLAFSIVFHCREVKLCFSLLLYDFSSHLSSNSYIYLHIIWIILVLG